MSSGGVYPTMREQIDALEEQVEKLKKQLPDGMQDCTIEFKECSLGHGWLTATNWLPFPCPTCEKNQLIADIVKLKGVYTS